MHLSARIALVALATGFWAPRAGAEPRVGFVNLSAPRAAVVSLRERATQSGYRVLADGELQAALESRPTGPVSFRAELADRELDAAKEAYAGFDFDRALDALEEADRVLLGAPPDRLPVERLARRHLLAGLVREARGEPARARAAFRMVVRLEPERTTLDPGLYRPDLVSLFEEAARRESEAPRRAIAIRTEPPGALVFIDGRRIGAAPVEARVTEGRHYVGVHLAGREPHVERVRITRGGPRSIRLQPLTRGTRAQALLGRLAAARTQRARERAAAALADLAGASALVFVRRKSRDALEAAIYRRDEGRLGDWMPAPSARLFAALAAAEPDRRRAGTAPPRRRDRDPEEQPWYRTWWGVGLLAGGAALVTGAVVLSLTADGGTTYEVDDFCFERTCR